MRFPNWQLNWKLASESDTGRPKKKNTKKKRIGILRNLI